MTDGAARWQVRTTRPVAYDVFKAPRLFAPGNATLAAFGRVPGRRFVILDAEVARHFGPAIRASFRHQGLDAHVMTIPGGEENKTLAAYESVARALDAFPIHRRDEPVIAIGGGVVTDIAAFVAATWRRGVPHIKVPTTLMGFVDAAIGIKAGVNFDHNKNRLGAFEPPLAVLLDKTLMATLPRRHLLNGLCEIIKLAVISDADLFALLEQTGAAAVESCFAGEEGDAILDRAITGMLDELTPNLFEDTLARRVDFGHTFSYGLEARHPRALLHGEAVLLDILVSTVVAEGRGLLTRDDGARIFALLHHLGIRPDATLLDGDAMWRALDDRVAHRNGFQRTPMPSAIGSCTFVNDLTRGEIDAALPILHAHLEARHEPAC